MIPAGEETERKEKLKTKWAAREALVGSEKRICLIAEDLVQHFERLMKQMREITVISRNALALGSKRG